MSIDFSVYNASFRSLFGESATYKPRTGDTRAITVVIDRHPPEPLPEAPPLVRPAAHVFADNDATTGISTDELDTGGDEISFPPRLDESAADWTIVRLINQDNGMVQLEVR